MLGGVLSIAVKILTIVLSISAFQEVILMEEPLITNYSRPMSLGDRDELGSFQLADHRYIIAVEMFAITPKRSGVKVPAEYGTMFATVNKETEKGVDLLEMRPCEDLISTA